MDNFALILLSLAVFFPLVCSGLCFIVKNSTVRKGIVSLSTLVMFAIAGAFVALLYENGGTIEISMESITKTVNWGLVISVLDVVLMLYIIFVGFKLKKWYIPVLALLQIVPMLAFEIIKSPEEAVTAFVIDYLALVMILLVSVIGPVIVFFALGYMKEHEEHLHLKKSRQPRFFMILFLFLAAMNALVMTNDLIWMYFFWEITTLCSFLLIGHDQNEVSIKNSIRALTINLLGGVGFAGAIIAIYTSSNTIEISELLKNSMTKDASVLLLLGLGCLCFAGFTKTAQFPFQSWLLGAMVAPTPVSALLHSSTMVKAGVYLIVRFAPTFAHTLVGDVVAIMGAFTFVAGSAIAISQRNAKRVLAYSTIANLGLIICCAGIGSSVALAAAILLIVFHALSKGLLFCVGTIENEIGSRDIEDMQGLMKRMPFTTVVTVLGMISMLLPPFGVLITKWAAIEAAVKMPLVLIPIVIGSAFTVVFWSKWIGIMLTMSYRKTFTQEKLAFSVKSSLIFLLVLVFVVSLGIGFMNTHVISPQLELFGLHDSTGLTNDLYGIFLFANSDIFGGFSSVSFFLIFLALLFSIPFFFSRIKPSKMRAPYSCGENLKTDPRGIEFTGPMDQVSESLVHNFYLTGVFGEETLTLWANIISAAIILIMFGVAL